MLETKSGAQKIHPRLEATRLAVLGHLDQALDYLEQEDFDQAHFHCVQVKRVLYEGIETGGCRRVIVPTVPDMDDYVIVKQVIREWLARKGRIAHRVQLCQWLDIWPWALDVDVRDVLEAMGVDSIDEVIESLRPSAKKQKI